MLRSKHSTKLAFLFGAKDDPRQQEWNERQILTFAKSYAPLSLVEDPNFLDHWLRFVPQLNPPTRREFRTVLIPALYTKTLQKYVVPEFEAADVYALTYDLWMTYGTVNVFAVNAHSLRNESNQWRRKIVLLGLVRVGSPDGSTAGLEVSKTLASLITRLSAAGLSLEGRYIGCNTDGGSNLDILRKDAAGLTCKLFPSLTVRFAELCGMHILGGALKAGLLKENLDSEAHSIYFDSLHKRVVAALAWPRKAEKPRRIWDTRCLAHGLVPKLPPSAVPTRPISRIELYEAALKYKAVLDDLYNPTYSPEIKARKKTCRLLDKEWEHLTLLVDAMGRLKGHYYRQQSEGYWALSDSIAATLRLCVELDELDRLANAKEDSGQILTSV